jgi:hypothetical protein
MMTALKTVAGDAAMSAEANKKLMEEIFAVAANPDPAIRDRSLFYRQSGR